MMRLLFVAAACTAVVTGASWAGAQTRAKVLFPSVRTYPVISPDGQHLIFSMADDRKKLKIFRLTVALGEVVQLTSGDHEDSAATYSPDGKLIAFQREWADESRDLWVMNADGSGARAVTKTPGINEQHPGFMPDGKYILVDGNLHADRSKPEAEQNYEIYMIGLSDGRVRRLTDRPGWDMYPTASPDGQSLVWQGATGTPSSPPDFDIFVRRIDGGAMRAIAPSPSYETQPDWHPSGEHIVFASDRGAKVNRRLELYVSDLNGLNLRRMTDGGGTDLAYARPRFSRNGKSIVANRNAAGMIDIVSIDYSPTN